MNRLSRHTCTQSKRLYREVVPSWRAGGGRNTGGLPCHMAQSLGFHGDGISFQVALGQSFWFILIQGPSGGTHITQPRWMPVRRILGGGRTPGVCFWLFPNSSIWWWFVRSVTFTRTSCGKITHTNGYYYSWPGWVVSVSVLPLTTRYVYLRW